MKTEQLERSLIDMARTFTDGVPCPAAPSFAEETRPQRHRPGIKWLVAAVVCVALLSGMTVIASRDTWYEGEPTGGVRMHIASAEGLTDTPLAEATDQGISIRVVEAVAGQGRVAVRIQFNGADMGEADSLVPVGHMTLTDDEGNIYPMTHDNEMVAKDVRYTTRKRLFQFDKGENYEEPFEFEGQPTASGTVTLHITEIGGCKGEWTASFPLTHHPEEVYTIDQTFPCGVGTLYVQQAVTDALGTTLFYRLDGLDEEYHSVDFDIFGSNNYPFRLLEEDEEHTRGYGYLISTQTLPQADGSTLRAQTIIRLPEDAILRIRVGSVDVAEIRLEEYAHQTVS